MPRKKTAKTMKEVNRGQTCHRCGVCGAFHWVLPIVIIALVWMYPATLWAQWVITVAAILLLAKKWCPCQWKR